MKENINIFFTINDSYSCYLGTAIASILYNTQTTKELNFYILDGGISEDNKRKLDELKKIKNFNIEYLAISTERFKNIPHSSQAHISNETNYRFLISSLKPDIDKCIFIDADLIFDKDIEELWKIDIEQYYMGAVTDQAPLRPDCWAEKLPLPQDYIYVNTGVTIMNLKKWREDKVEEKFFDNVNKYATLLRFPDQDILNITLFKKVKYISHRFNAMPVQTYLNETQKTEAFQSPIVIHWAGRRKPWINPGYPYGDKFWYYARMTPFYEEIIYKNLKSTFSSKLNNFGNKEMLKDIVEYGKNKFNYYRCRILCNFTLGSLRKHYKEKKKDLKTRIKRVKKFLKGQ